MLDINQRARLLSAIDALAEAPRAADTLADLVNYLASQIDPRDFPAFLGRVRSLSRYPGPGGLLGEYQAVRETGRDELSPEQKWGPKPAVCDHCKGAGFVENTEARRYEICPCPDAIDAETLAKLNAKFSGKQPTPERRRLLSTARFMERVGS